MLAKRHQSVTVHLAFISAVNDLPVWNIIEAQASMFQNEAERFHLLLEQQDLPQSSFAKVEQAHQGMFWLDISPYQISMTMQSNSRLSYHHFWSRGIYGTSRYCLNTQSNLPSQLLNLRNFTRFLEVDSNPFPRQVRIEYEMWSDKVNLDSSILYLEIN